MKIRYIIKLIQLKRAADEKNISNFVPVDN